MENRSPFFLNRDDVRKTKRFVVLGILNLTPDSFSDGGMYNDIESSLRKIEELRTFSTILDIGGESTRPGAVRISCDEELSRIREVVKFLNAKNMSFSIDTVNLATAQFAVKHGCKLINDISGAKIDPRIVTELMTTNTDIDIIINHWRDFSHNMYKTASYSKQPIDDIGEELLERLNFLKQHSVKLERVILDVGIGFNKRYDCNIHILKNMERLRELKRPFLIAISRKRFIRQFFGLADNCSTKLLDIASSLMTKKLLEKYDQMIWGIRTHAPEILVKVITGELSEQNMEKKLERF